MHASVIIPTYNRKQLLQKTINSLIQQTYPNDWFEVIVVDDGSNDGTDKIAQTHYPLNLRYIHQPNQGDAAARNLGAQQAKYELLVFLDDDIIVEPDYLRALLSEYNSGEKHIVLGTTRNEISDPDSMFQVITAQATSFGDDPTPSFDQLCSNNMSVRKEVYFLIGGMEGLGINGSNIWCDVDFGYRAHLMGYQLYRCQDAIAYHHDQNLIDKNIYYHRIETASSRAVLLFKKNPDLIHFLPMFEDKTSISLKSDSPKLILSKLFHLCMAWDPVLDGMEKIVGFVESYYPSPVVLRYFYRWISSSYLLRGYRRGLLEYGK